MKVKVGVQPVAMGMGAHLRSIHVTCGKGSQAVSIAVLNLEWQHAAFTVRMFAAVNAQQATNTIAI